MKLFIFTFLFFLSTGVQAAPSSEDLKSLFLSQSECGPFVKFDENNLYMGLPNGRIRMLPLEGGNVFEWEADAIDFLPIGDFGYVLTKNSLDEWDITRKIKLHSYETYLGKFPFANKENPQALASYKDKLIIAHGRLGVSFFDLKTKHISKQFRLIPKQMPLESMATAITVQGKYAYIAMDNYHLVKPGERNLFRGIVIIDLDSEEVVAELDGMDPGADSILSDEKNLLVGFSGLAIWKYRINSLKGENIPEPAIRIWRYPYKGHPWGKPALDAKYYFTCFLQVPSEGGGSFKNIPLVIDRRVYLLD